MCGIAGWLGPAVEDESITQKMIDALRHRGPDAGGVRHLPGASLIHTRLSIIDLSPAGAQPMANEDQTVWTIFNGEIYNHKELRGALLSRGHRFQGHADTEVLPHLYEEEGADFIRRLRGMFAFAVYDAPQRRLLLARDRFGIKPLFFAPTPERLVFASEICALRAVPGVDDSPSPQALSDFAALLYIPAPETFYRGIHALQPGELLEARWHRGRIHYKTRFYHLWSLHPNPDLPLSEAIERADALITQAVKRQLESDVPLGSLLSGGIDSSLVSASVCRDGVQNLRTFNVRFPDTRYDETWAAEEVAKHIGSEHRTLDMSEKTGTWDTITRLLLQAGQPFADTSLFAVHAVCRLMRQHVTVALSGDGGDEGFGGYESYRLLTKILAWRWLPRSVRSVTPRLIEPLALFGLLPKRLPQRMSELSEGDETAVLQDIQCWIRGVEHRKLCPLRDVLPPRRFFEPRWDYNLSRTASCLERLSAHLTEINVRLRLANDYLFKVDTASMAESLEVRVPLLDEDLFDFALSLPHHLKVKGKQCKRVLRAVAEKRLPKAVAHKSKQGFAIPVDTWVDANFKNRLREYLLASISPLSDAYNMDVYRPMVEAFCDGLPYPGVSRAGLYQRVIMLLAVQLALSSR